jgi:2,3,4,5-tetrahydropyridine-2,6-dicarboxylate N-succinyltransferase
MSAGADNLAKTIDAAFERRDEIGPKTEGAVREAVEEALDLLDRGAVRVAEPASDGPSRGTWRVNQWLKKAVLLSFRLNDMSEIAGAPGHAVWWDKVPSKFDHWDEKRFRAAGFRAVPGCVVRRSAYIAPGVVLMPSFVNLGAYVDSGTMVDTLREGSVLSMGVFIGASTKIVDRDSGKVLQGEVPPYSVVVPGTMPGTPNKAGAATPNLYCAVIVKRVDEKTRAKTSINELLRD